jgi:Tfp pilus assembly protein PilO
MKARSRKKPGPPKTWLITGLLAAAAVAYVVFLFLPGQRAIDKVRAEVQERRQQIMQAQSLMGTVAAARLRLTAAREVGQTWRSTAPRQTQLVTHIARLTRQAEEAGVGIDRLDPATIVERNLIAEQNVTLQFHARFPAVFDLLNRLESQPGTLWIRSLTLHRSRDDDNLLRGELTLTIFVDRAD